MRPTDYADKQDRWFPAVMLGPVLIAIFVLVIAPLVWGLRISLTDSRMIGLGFKTGLTFENYRSVLSDPDTWNAIWVTIVFSGGTVVGSVVLGMAAALVLDREFFGRGFVRVLVILPWAVPHVVAALVWQWMYNPDFGVVNYGLLLLPWVTSTPKWLSDPQYALLAIILVNVWKTYPFAALLLLAGLQTISDDLYEASAIDGAGPLRRFFDITLPGLRRVLAIVVLLLLIWSFGNFVFIFLMTQGGPAGATNALVVHIYFEAFRFFRAGSAFAMGALLLAMSIILTSAYIVMSREREHG